MSSQDLRDLLVSFLWRITIYENRIEIKIGRAELRKQLQSGNKIIPANHSDAKSRSRRATGSV
jgi:hypothetical protein